MTTDKINQLKQQRVNILAKDRVLPQRIMKVVKDNLERARTAKVDMRKLNPNYKPAAVDYEPVYKPKKPF